MNQKRVEVYWNIPKQCYSVRSLEGESKGRVISHSNSLSISDATFAVQPAGRRRVLIERTKNVHAFVRGHSGQVTDMDSREPVEFDRYENQGWVKVKYNPYKGAHFVTESGQPVESAPLVHCLKSEDGRASMFALNPVIISDDSEG